MNKTNGFSLLEILIAFAILAISLTILLKIFSTGVNTALIAEEYNQAVQLAEGLMAKSGTEMPLQTGITTGDSDKFHWTITINPYTPVSNNFNSKNMTVDLFKVKVQVNWGDDFFKQRQFELITLKLVNKNL